MRARTVAFLLIALCAAGPACAVGFLTQKELAARDGDTVIVVPAYTYVTVTQRFGTYAIITYRDGDEVRELRVTQSDLDSARPAKTDATETSDAAKLGAFYLERIPFDVYIDEFRGTAPPEDAEAKPGPTEYRIRIKTCNLVPEVLPLIRFEVQVYFDTAPDAAQHVRGNRLWQLRVLSIEPREIRTVETPVFSAKDLQAAVPDAEAATREDQTKTSEGPAKEAASEAEGAESADQSKLRFAVRLFVDELFVAQRTGVVRRIEEKELDPSWTNGIPYFGGSSYRRHGQFLQGSHTR